VEVVGYDEVVVDVVVVVDVGDVGQSVAVVTVVVVVVSQLVVVVAAGVGCLVPLVLPGEVVAHSDQDLGELGVRADLELVWAEVMVVVVGQVVATAEVMVAVVGHVAVAAAQGFASGWKTAVVEVGPSVAVSVLDVVVAAVDVVVCVVVVLAMVADVVGRDYANVVGWREVVVVVVGQLEMESVAKEAVVVVETEWVMKVDLGSVVVSVVLVVVVDVGWVVSGVDGV
jgi:hypothetical protein